MNFFIRTNYNNKLGIGHLMRSRRVAAKLRKKGHIVFIVVDEYNSILKSKDNYISLYEKQKFKSQEVDAELFCKKTKKFGEGFVILDDYRFGEKWETKVKKFHKKIITFDDNEKLNHNSDIIINYNPRHYPTVKYNFKKNKNKNSIYLINPNYCVISKKKIFKGLKKKYITFYLGGGGDFKDIIEIIKNLSNIRMNKNYNFKIKIIIGPLSKNQNLITKLFKRYKFISITKNSLSLEKVIFQTKLFISTAGTSLFEAATYDVPTILLEKNTNQKTNILSLEQIGHYIYLPYGNLKKTKKFTKLIENLILNLNRIKKLINKKKLKINDNGVEKIIDTIFNKKKIKKVNKNIKSKISKKLTISNVKDADINEYLLSRNLFINRRNSINDQKIPIIDHYNWWFVTKRKSFVLKNNLKKMLYIYEEKILNLKGVDYILSGWFASNENCGIREIVYALNWQKKRNKRNSKWISLIKKTNTFSIKLSKYLGWKKLEPSEEITKKLIKFFNVNYNKYFFYIR